MTQTPFSTITLFPKRKPTVSSSPNPVAIKTQSPPPPPPAPAPAPTLSPLKTPPREIQNPYTNQLKSKRKTLPSTTTLFPNTRPPLPLPLNTPLKNNKTTKTMDSHVSLASFTCRDTLVMILRKLGARDLARASCVCKLWRDMASDDAIVRPAFMEPWKLKEIVGEPVSGSFWRENGIWKFAISHKIARGDSVTSLAKKYSVQVRDIKLLNNMISDNGIYSRERLLIPIINPNSLINGICYIELDTHAKREVLVLYPGGQPDKKLM